MHRLALYRSSMVETHPPLGPHDQVVRYADVGGATVAWSAVGSGPPLIIGGWWCSHVELNFADNEFRAFLSRLAAHRTVYRYDRPGSGASSRTSAVPDTLEDEVSVLAALVDALGLESVDLLGASSGAPVSAAYAATAGDRVRHLALYGGFVRGADIAPPPARAAMLDVITAHWGIGSRVLADLFIPEATPEERDRFAEFQRRSASPDVARASLRSTYAFDASSYLGRITSPTHVVHRTGDRAIPVALGRELARSIPGATFTELPGVDHFPWRGAAALVVADVLGFLGVAVPPPRAASASSAVESLSAREIEVLELVASGHTDAEIAATLHLSPHTVHRHVANARTKLDVRSRAAAASAWTAHRRGAGR